MVARWAGIRHEESGVKVLVTGHKGFIGSVMVPMLLDAGVDVVGMDTDFYRDCTFVSSMLRSFSSSVPPARPFTRKKAW